jgi:hypothetical protein
MRTCVVALSCLVVFGCSNHPLQDEVTGYDTDSIVKKLRCEAQQAIKTYIEKRHLQDDAISVWQYKERLKRYDEFTANNKAILSKIDKIIDDDDSESKRLAAEQRRIYATGKALDLEIDSLNTLKGVNEEIKNKRIAQLTASAITLAGRYLAIKAEIERREKASPPGLQSDAPKTPKDREIENNKEIKKVYSNFSLNEYTLIKNEVKRLQSERGADHKSSARRELFLINNAILAMKFDFKISENNNLVGGGSVTWPVHLGSLSLVYKAGSEKKRVAQRIVETQPLFEDLANMDCSMAPPTPADYAARRYPVVGNIGVDDFIEQYFLINEGPTVLSGKDTFTDTLTFTTKLTGQLNPVIEIKPLSPSLVKGALDFNSDREDVHTVSLQVRPYTPKDGASDTKIQITKVPEVTISIADQNEMRQKSILEP